MTISPAGHDQCVGIFVSKCVKEASRGNIDGRALTVVTAIIQITASPNRQPRTWLIIKWIDGTSKRCGECHNCARWPAINTQMTVRFHVHCDTLFEYFIVLEMAYSCVHIILDYSRLEPLLLMSDTFRQWFDRYSHSLDIWTSCEDCLSAPSYRLAKRSGNW